MAKIESYPLAPSTISGNDKMIGTDTANNNATKNFTVNQLISYIGLNGGFVPYIGAVADVNLNNKVLYAANGVFYGIVQTNTINITGNLYINSSQGTAGQVLVSQGIGNRPIWSSSIVTGPQGIQGPIGPQGVPGPAGPAGLNWRSSWVSGTSYIADDAVAYGGASWFCILATSGTTTPDLDTTHWALLASQGAIGPAGAPGAQGPTGATGATGAPGPTGTQTLQQVLDFDHALIDAKNYQGNFAGLNNTGNNVNAFGDNAANGNTANNINALGSSSAQGNIERNINAFGFQAALSNIGRNVNALGNGAATSNGGYNINALGQSSLESNSGSAVNALGFEAGKLNAFSCVNLFGYKAQATSINQTVLAGEFHSARLGYNGLTSDRLYTFPDKSGTFAMLSDITGGGSWSTLGNTGLGVANFIGTTDNADVIIKRNNVEQIRLYSSQTLFSNNLTVQKSSSVFITAINTTGRGIALAVDTTATNSGALQFYNSSFQSNLLADNPTAARDWQLPDESGTLALSKYTSYVATLTQSGTSAPTATVLENTTGLTVTWSYLNTGRYFATFSTSLNASKTFILAGSAGASNDTITIRSAISGANSIVVSSKDFSDNYINSTLFNTTIEVRIYP